MSIEHHERPKGLLDHLIFYFGAFGMLGLFLGPVVVSVFSAVFHMLREETASRHQASASVETSTAV